MVNVYKGDDFVRQLYPRQDFYLQEQQAMTIPGLYSTFETDVYVLLASWDTETLQTATFKVYVNPLVNCVWAGGFVFILGTLVAAWPEREHAPLAVTASRGRKQLAGAK